MPNYGTLSPTAALYPGSKGTAFNAEQPAVPQASVAFALCHPVTGSPNSFSVEIQFSGAPGAFEIDIQTADTDTDKAYINIPTTGAITAVDAATFRARAEFVTVRANFVRVYLKSRANAVNLTVYLNA